METYKRRVRSGKEYDHLFPRAKGRNRTVKRDANVSNTVNFIPQVVKATRKQTALIAPLLKGKTVRESCRKIFDFVYPHITYEKDAHGVRSEEHTSELQSHSFISY